MCARLPTYSSGLPASIRPPVRLPYRPDGSQVPSSTTQGGSCRWGRGRDGRRVEWTTRVPRPGTRTSFGAPGTRSRPGRRWCSGGRVARRCGGWTSFPVQSKRVHSDPTPGWFGWEGYPGLVSALGTRTPDGSNPFFPVVATGDNVSSSLGVPVDVPTFLGFT